MGFVGGPMEVRRAQLEHMSGIYKFKTSAGGCCAQNLYTFMEKREARENLKSEKGIVKSVGVSSA